MKNKTKVKGGRNNNRNNYGLPTINESNRLVHNALLHSFESGVTTWFSTLNFIKRELIDYPDILKELNEDEYVRTQIYNQFMTLKNQEQNNNSNSNNNANNNTNNNANNNANNNSNNNTNNNSNNNFNSNFNSNSNVNSNASTITNYNGNRNNNAQYNTNNANYNSNENKMSVYKGGKKKTRKNKKLTRKRKTKKVRK